ncbi:hypothetical protein J2S13_003216 [Oikeobacillus pervagus]|uniref:Alpha/beta hydrolase n=1 Tax=Oikeobacillus pervagus TaxID=1325931 RepID=A0AAJ1T3T8_9BACI|nr:alpha/beta-type small acid-soluble spore protein [Oikeobacillus pervagus]MDQ0216732.1 hypothetical protein [Oikeobacillus pervagus]
MARNNKILVPEARQVLDRLKAKVADTNQPDQAKFEIANEMGVPLNKGDNGNLTSKEAGKIGGKLGGNMVREMIKMAEQQLIRKK